MNKRLEQLEVKTDKDSMVTLIQKDPLGNDDAVICLHVDQVEFLIQWLKEAKEEIARGVNA